MLKPRRRKPDLYRVWPEAKRPTVKRRTKRKAPWATATLIAAGIFIGGVGATVWMVTPESDLGQARTALLANAEAKGQAGVASAASPSRTFGLCHAGGGRNCVVDGDTFWMDGVKIRIADIDAPETHPPRCTSEADLGNRTTSRLHELLNQGPIELETLPGRDEDRYGRRLRIVTRNGQSLGDQLVSEGLARTWTGRREPWC